MIFVFGSNLHGRHGKGAASTAKRFFGAKHRVGEGLTGQAYALPTKNGPYEKLPLDAIGEAFGKLVSTAREHPDKTFMLTRVGTGLSGYDDDDILAQLTQHPFPDNLRLPGVWQQRLTPDLPVRLIIAGGREFTDYAYLRERCDHLLSAQSGPIEIVSGTTRGADKLGERYYYERVAAEPERFSLVRFPANWTKFDKPAGHLRNSAMAWYATHLIAFWDGRSTGTKNMLGTATREQLTRRCVRYT
jgi:hypothetical protein